MSSARVTFLCRGSTDVGLGHIMRSRTVADALSRVGHATVRLVAIGDDSARSLLAGRDYPVCVTPDEDAAVQLVRATQPGAVVFDTTELDRDAFETAAGGALTASLSPVFDRLEDVDVVYHRASSHPLGPRSGWRMGADWAVVRPECRPIPDERYRAAIEPGRPLPVAICMGGGDAPNRTRDVLDRLRRIDTPMLFWVLLGEGYPHSWDELARIARGSTRHEIILARTTGSMWRILDGCAVAIMAGGTVTYEAAAAGLPSINLLHDPRQRWLVNDLVDGGAAFAPAETGTTALDTMAETLTRLEARRGALLAARECALGRVDGRAADRIGVDLLAGLARRGLVEAVRGTPMSVRSITRLAG